ncbi:DUF86 domain-containing protein [Candidatus Poribacteria bacterium]|nr:DUF86 domain-containing protein [Candidatus Poribacteria bacterium]
MEKEIFETIRRKLCSMLKYLDELENELPTEVEDYLNAGRILHGFVERNCQVAIECAIDANELLISITGGAIPESARDSFEAVHQPGAIEEEVCLRFQNTFVGFRNRLVHDYEQVDNRIVYYTARLLITYGKRYVINLTDYLDRLQQTSNNAALVNP